MIFFFIRRRRSDSAKIVTRDHEILKTENAAANLKNFKPNNRKMNTQTCCLLPEIIQQAVSVRSRKPGKISFLKEQEIDSHT